MSSVIIVEELKVANYDIFSEEVHRLIPNYCFECGLPLQINPTYTGLTCMNSKCTTKVAKRAVAFLRDINFLGLGESAMLNFVKDMELTSPVQLYMLEESDLEDIKESAYKEKLKDLIKHLDGRRELKIEDYVVLANIPDLQLATAESLFKGYSDLGRFYRTLEVEGTNFIQKQLEIKTELSLKTLKLYDNLTLYKEELLDPIEGNFVTILEPSDDVPTIQLVISDDAGGHWPRKKDFQEDVISRYAGKYDIVFKSSVTKKTDVLIWAGGRHTSKVAKASGYGLPIIDGTTFVEIADVAPSLEIMLDSLQGRTVE